MPWPWRASAFHEDLLGNLRVAQQQLVAQLDGVGGLQVGALGLAPALLAAQVGQGAAADDLDARRPTLVAPPQLLAKASHLEGVDLAAIASLQQRVEASAMRGSGGEVLWGKSTVCF